MGENSLPLGDSSWHEIGVQIQVERPWDLARDSGQRSWHIPIRITAHPRGAFISVGDWTHTETNLLSLTTWKRWESSRLSSSRTHVRLGAWFWSAKADIFFSESLHSTLRFGRRKTIVSQTMCALAENLSQSEIELPLRNTCYYSPLAEVGVSTQTEMNVKKCLRHFNSPAPHSWGVRGFFFINNHS